MENIESKRRMKSRNGITLVALVVTIVVLLLLAGITISYVMGDNSVFKKASEAKLQTEIGKIEEQAGLIYSDKWLAKVSNNSNDKPTMQEIVEELRKDGYTIEQVEVSGNAIIGISLDKESMNLSIEGTSDIKATIEMGSGMNYYAVVSGKYYQMHYNNGNITIDRIFSEVSNEETTTPMLTVISGNENIVIANIDNTTNTITVTAKNEGTTIITVSSNDGSSQSAICTITVTPPKLADIVEKIQEKNREVEDENGNKVVVPGGFRVLPHGTKSGDIDEVIYNYDTNHKPCVQDGIVIADEEDNQFVWIPIGDIKNKDGTATTITLGRYTFNTSNGTPTLQQNANNYTETVIVESYYQELTTSDYKNAAAKNLGEFVSKTNSSGGYYLARYEASKGIDQKAKSQYNKTSWGEIAQRSDVSTSDATREARRMYENNSYVESDLINSYSWDTAIVFIQKYSGNSNYANKTSVNSGKDNTGRAGDKVCNIHDMASNYVEWTTEHCTYTQNDSNVYDAVHRGGQYTTSMSCTRYRAGNNPCSMLSICSFRPLIYIK